MYKFELLRFVKDNESDEGWHRADENGDEDVELMMVTMMMTRIMMVRMMMRMMMVTMIKGKIS